MAVHHHDVVHLDIKPANILLTKAGDAKLTDFGVSKLIEEESVAENGMLTGAKGTPAFLAPECCTGVHELRMS